MAEKHKRQFIWLIIIYFGIYLISFLLEQELLMILIKPGATLLAWTSLRFFTPMLKENRSVKELVSIAFLSWFIADVIAMIGELIIFTGGHDPLYFYNLEIALYAVSRIFILLTIAGLYRYVTRKTSKFQVMADLITLGTCIATTIWLVVFKGASVLHLGVLSAADLMVVFALFYIVISLLVQGLLLLNWLYFKERAMNIGHKVGLTGLAIITFTDLMCAFYPSLMIAGNAIDLAYKVGILMVALGGVYFDYQSVTQLREKRPINTTDTWKNGFYFLAYPLFTFFIIGMNPDIFIFLLVIAFYMVCCLYTRQIEVTKALLKKEKAYNESIKNQHYFTTQLLDAMPGGIFYISRDDVLLGMNSRLKRYYGLEAEDFIGRHLSEFPWMTGDEYCLIREMKKAALAKKHSSIRQVDYREINSGTGVALFSISVYYLADGSIGGFLGLFTDITELKAKESELEVALKKANAATEAKSQFLANMSHEIRTPMNAIIGMAYLTLQTELSPQQKDYLLKMHGAATALLGIINDILDFSKIEAGKLELEKIDFNIEKVISDATALFVEMACEKNLEFLVQLPPELSKWFRGDPLRLGQVLTNLVGNAIKFTEAGEVVIAIDVMASQDHRQQLQFAVRDTGVGISRNSLDRLFEPFMQSDNSTTRHYGGTGLGLTISQNLVNLMGGRLQVESTKGVGSTFSFTIWLELSHAQYSTACETVDRNDRRGCLRDIRVLLAEDNSLNRQIAEELLAQEGALIDAVVNGQEALDRVIAMAAPDDYDLILMDLQMPVMDGFEATRKIRIINRTIPILAMTARTMTDEKAECLKNGMNDHIAKPIDPLVLYNTILKYVSPRKKNTDTDSSDQVEAISTIPLPEIDGIDAVAVNKRFGSNQTLFVSLLKLFNDTQSQLPVDLEAARAGGDREVLKRLLHTAKGVLGNIGAMALFEQLQVIEDCCSKPQQEVELAAQLSTFSSDFEKLQALIAQTLAINDGTKQQKMLEKRGDDRQFAEVVERLQCLLDDGDSEALDYFTASRRVLSGQIAENQLTQLEQAINTYDFDAALAQLNRFLEEK